MKKFLRLSRQNSEDRFAAPGRPRSRTGPAVFAVPSFNANAKLTERKSLQAKWGRRVVHGRQEYGPKTTSTTRWGEGGVLRGGFSLFQELAKCFNHKHTPHYCGLLSKYEI